MKKNCRGILLLLFSLMTVWAAAFPTEARAAEPRMTTSTSSGKTTLEVYGDGVANSSIIWSSLDRTSITAIVIDSGITGLGPNLFKNFSNVTSVTIASTVTSIGNNAFQGCSSLKEITIPGSVTQIGEYAFAGCSSLYYIGLSKGLQSIGDNAFYNCTALKKVTLPSSLIDLSGNAFRWCTSLTEIVLTYGNTSYSVKNNVLFNADGTELIIHPEGLGGLYQVPEGTKVIGKEAFAWNINLSDVTLPDGVTRIDDYAFYACKSLVAVTIPESVTTIGSDVFTLRQNLTIYGVQGSYAETYANSNNIPFKELESPKLELSNDNIEISVRGNPNYNQQVEAAKTLTITNTSSRYVEVRTDIYSGDYPADSASSAFQPGNYMTTLGPGESMTHKVQPRERTCGYTYNYSLHVTANGELYREVPVSITFFHYNPNYIPEVAPTCTTDGSKAYYKCYTCGGAFYDPEGTMYATASDRKLPATGHQWGDASYTWAEDNSSVTASRICSNNQEHVETETVETLCEVLEAPACEEAGTGEYTATFENKAFETQTKDGEIPAKGHKKETVAGKEATCTETGLTEGEKCSVCDEILLEQEEIPAKGHTKETVAGKEATCTETGLTEGEKCSVCGEVLTAQKEIPAKGHTKETVAGKAATCTETGLTEGEKCSVCDEILLEQEEIPATGHTKVVVAGKAATCTETGLTGGEKCSVCDEILLEQEEIPATGHTKVVVAGKAATCTETGLTEGERCSVCGSILKAQKQIPAIGHAYGAWTTVKKPTYDAEGQELRVCANDKTHIETRTVARLEKPEDTTPETEYVPTLDELENTVTNQKSDKDPENSRFGALQAKVVKVSNTTLQVQWKRVKGATKYIVYGNKCGKNNRLKKLKTVSGTSYKQKKLKKGTYYKYLVVAVKGNKAISTSKVVHATTNGKYGNAIKITVGKTNVTVKKGKTYQIKAKVQNNKKAKKHRDVAYESSNPKIAKVTAKGKIKGLKKGTCYVYAYAQNGLMKKITVTVK